MGFCIQEAQFNAILKEWQKQYHIYAPKVYKGGGRFSDTDCIRYGEISQINEIVFDRKSQYSFKEILTPVSQTLFYFTEGETKEADGPRKGAVLFLRSCDLHGLKRLDDMYLQNGPADYYYSRLRENIKIVLMGCGHSFENCFCVSMGTNQSTNYDLSIDRQEDGTYLADCRDPQWNRQLAEAGCASQEVVPQYVTENAVRVTIPETLTAEAADSRLWDQYDSRCIHCGRCNFVCPTCTCFTMQDLFYSENGKVGERRRVWASCMVDGFTDVAGGGSYRQKNGQRMRFKVLHKVLDYKQRNGYHMCVGCGRCDDICPEYISFSNCVNQLEEAMTEVKQK
ncbi:MAG TPA: anaerobic sulfite reductase subunit AsrA [Candidatus Blautia merdavium]|uniref:Anaerobic sulfite reductase subunit AsrA n=1 Tax=Candidatus Blautia merdavium TaxID=2838494 RepID=A0A9D2PLT8_9FIRM|nr:anaerobic sulfite reductase subunit AsrA [Candidatus Blautia merdavium]